MSSHMPATYVQEFASFFLELSFSSSDNSGKGVIWSLRISTLKKFEHLRVWALPIQGYTGRINPEDSSVYTTVMLTGQAPRINYKLIRDIPTSWTKKSTAKNW